MKFSKSPCGSEAFVDCDPLPSCRAPFSTVTALVIGTKHNHPTSKGTKSLVAEYASPFRLFVFWLYLEVEHISLEETNTQIEEYKKDMNGHLPKVEIHMTIKHSSNFVASAHSLLGLPTLGTS